MITLALEKSGRDLKAAARELGLSEEVLIGYLSRYQITSRGTDRPTLGTRSGHLLDTKSPPGDIDADQSPSNTAYYKEEPPWGFAPDPRKCPTPDATLACWFFKVTPLFQKGKNVP